MVFTNTLKNEYLINRPLTSPGDHKQDQCRSIANAVEVGFRFCRIELRNSAKAGLTKSHFAAFAFICSIK
jgi:ribosomal protein S14